MTTDEKDDRPTCPIHGTKMHKLRQEDMVIWRCEMYPACQQTMATSEDGKG